MLRIVGFVSALLLLFASAGYAHPPAGIEATFNGRTLIVVVNHAVTDPHAHHIDKIEVFVNDQLAIVQNIFIQARSHITVSYTILSAAYGDVIRVKARCNMGGEAETTVIVQRPGEQPAEETQPSL